MKAFFKELKVVELASILAGPAVGMFFAELGAKVLKIENKASGGDTTRQWRLPGEASDGPSAYFCAVNYAKQYLSLDLKMPEDRERLHAELRTADMVLSNFRPQTARKLGVDLQDLCAKYPKLIALQLDGFEQGTRAAYDVVLQAETGWISMTGTSPDDLAKMPVAVIDLLAGHQLKEAALLALLKRERTGEGSVVRCSLERTSLASLANQATNYLMQHHVARPIGTLHPNIAPYGDWFRSADGKAIVLAVGSNPQFAALCTAIGLAGMEAEADFATNEARVVHRTALRDKLAQAIQQIDAATLGAALDGANVPYGWVRTMDEVLHSPAARALVREEEIEGYPTSRLSSIAFTTDFLGI